MVDLPLMRALLKALPDEAALVQAAEVVHAGVHDLWRATRLSDQV